MTEGFCYRVASEDTRAPRAVREDGQQCDDHMRHLARASRPRHGVLVPRLSPGGRVAASAPRADRVDRPADVTAAHHARSGGGHGQLQLRAHLGRER